MSVQSPVSHVSRRGAARLASLGISLAALVAGCSLLRGPTPQPTRFFVLDTEIQAAPSGRRLAIGIGPVSLPPYLDRPEMVIRVNENQLFFDEFNRWSESLKDNFVRVFAADLDRLVGFDRVVFFPWYSNTPLDYAVTVAVLRFEAQPDGDVWLDARWSIADGERRILLNRDTHLSQPGGSPAQRAAAMSALTSALAGEVAAAMRELDVQRH